MEKLEWCGYPMVTKIEDVSVRFDRMCECDRHTYSQTPHGSIGRACIASRGKNTVKLHAVSLCMTHCCQNHQQLATP